MTSTLPLKNLFCAGFLKYEAPEKRFRLPSREWAHRFARYPGKLMAKLEKLKTSMFPHLYKSFFREDDPLTSEEDWEKTFNYIWAKEEDGNGYVLTEQSDIVGVIGTIFSKRIIDGKEYKFCNLHNWYVKEKNRGRGRQLMKPILNLKDYTITNFTPTDRGFTISKKLGFKELDSSLRIFFSPNILNKSSASSDYQFILDKKNIEAALYGKHRKIFSDHKNYGCSHILVRSKSNPNDDCYIVYTRVTRYIRPYCYIHYLSNTDLFEKAYRLICRRLSHLNNCLFTVIENRFVSKRKFPFSLKFPFKNPQLYLTSQVQPKNIDTLYSEIVFLKLCTFPDLSKMVGRWFRKK